jgi:hypothetical protein
MWKLSSLRAELVNQLPLIGREPVGQLFRAVSYSLLNKIVVVVIFWIIFARNKVEIWGFHQLKEKWIAYKSFSNLTGSTTDQSGEF